MKPQSLVILSLSFGSILGASCGKKSSDKDDVQPRLEITTIHSPTALVGSHKVKTYRDFNFSVVATGLEGPSVSCEGCPTSLKQSMQSDSLFYWWPSEWDVGAHELVFTATGKDGTKVSTTLEVLVEFDASIIGSFIGMPYGRDVNLLSHSQLELADSTCFKGSRRVACPWIREVKTADLMPSTLAVLHASPEDEAEVVILHPKKFMAPPRLPHLFHLFPMDMIVLDDEITVEVPHKRNVKVGQLERMLVRCQGADRIELESSRPDADKLTFSESSIFRGEAGFIPPTKSKSFEVTPTAEGESTFTITCGKGDRVLTHDFVITVTP